MGEGLVSSLRVGVCIYVYMDKSGAHNSSDNSRFMSSAIILISKRGGVQGNVFLSAE